MSRELMSGDLLDFVPCSPGLAAEVAPLPRASWESSSLGLSVLFGSDDGGGTAKALDEAHSEALAEARALERHNAQLMAALIARRGRLREIEADAQEDEARQQAQLEAAEAEVCREQAQVRMLRQLLQRAEEDANAAEAARLVEKQHSEEASMLQSEIEEQRVVLSAMRQQLAAVPKRVRGAHGSWSGLHAIDAGSEADITLERCFAMRLTEDLRTELQAVRQELAVQQLHGSGITTRTEVLEEELRTLRAEFRGDDGRQSESLMEQRPQPATAARAVPRGTSTGATAHSTGPSEVSHSINSCSTERILQSQLQELSAVDARPSLLDEELVDGGRRSDPTGSIRSFNATCWKGNEKEVANLRATNAALRQRLVSMERPSVYR